MTSHITDRSVPKPLEGKIALITGASKRIGRAIAIALAEEGVGIVAHDRSALEGEIVKVCDEVAGCGAKSWKIIADLEKKEDYESLISRSIQTAGSLEILINNASIFFPSTIADVGFRDITRHVQVNAWTPFVLCREFARLGGRGKIINLLDTRIAGYDREHVAYILSKRMLATMTRMCALEYAPAITVNGVAPGLILPPAGKDEDYLARLAQTMPLRRHGEPGDVTGAVLYLLGSDYITGQIIYVDGGQHLLEDGNGQDSNW
ncbi:MAG TPA: SDR family oxidoreductase [Nitrospirota bacterium]|nr:SDR family oxidoreductase [Nitrospirota bacterium]